MPNHIITFIILFNSKFSIILHDTGAVIKIEINNETNELNFLFGGYFSGRGSVTIKKYGKLKGSYAIRASLFFDSMKFAKLFEENFGGGYNQSGRRV